MSGELAGTVIAVSCNISHRFSKVPKLSVKLVKDHGIEGDAHAGRFMKHRYLAKRVPKLANNRQVHLIESELFGDLKLLGFEVRPGELGENITTRGINLLELPLGSLLHLGNDAIVELTGLRTRAGVSTGFKRG
jgi:MOSC domain-containing protein YiiM